MQHLKSQQPTLFGSALSVDEFFEKYWQKKPYLFRSAFAREALAIGRDELFAFAESELPSRLISRSGENWQVEPGPFKRSALKKKTQSAGWTLLVQDLNTRSEAAARILSQFRFLPDARLDDLMASYAVDGAGVGPHFDSYDVFLLQARGVRRWGIAPLKTAAQRALRLDQPLKILERFKATESFDLAEGDMLYLPPGYAHDGVAVGECVTYSIGFRAPSAAELIAQLYEDMAEAVRQDPRFAVLYEDANVRPQASAARLPEALLAFMQTHLREAQASPEFIETSLANYLTEPKPWLVLEGSDADGSSGILLSKKSRLLLGKRCVYLNGEAFEMSVSELKWWERFSATQRADAGEVARASEGTRAILEEGLEAGWFEAVAEK
jgi:50S ribosomal protein L16 3-hydroxylase